MKAEAPSKSVPREFIGRARQFRERILAADGLVMPVLDRLYDPLAERARRNPRPRPELIAAASRAWAMQMPEFGRLGERRVRKSSRALTIAEARLSSGRLRQPTWDQGETDPGFSIAFITLELSETMCKLTAHMVAAVTLHAVGRWFQRASSDDSETALLADFARLAAEYGRILDDHARVPSERRFLSNAKPQRVEYAVNAFPPL
jgi:hypothetical protein